MQQLRVGQLPDSQSVSELSALRARPGAACIPPLPCLEGVAQLSVTPTISGLISCIHLLRVVRGALHSKTGRDQSRQLRLWLVERRDQSWFWRLVVDLQRGPGVSGVTSHDSRLTKIHCGPVRSFAVFSSTAMVLLCFQLSMSHDRKFWKLMYVRKQSRVN